MPKVKKVSEGHYGFMCPGCGDRHDLPVQPDLEKGWGFNHDLDKPTFTPSILTQSGHYTRSSTPEEKENCKACNDPDFPFNCYVCHSFVTDGKIQFLSDCTHELAGQTIPLPECD